MSDSKISDQKDNSRELSEVVEEYDLQPLSVKIRRTTSVMIMRRNG